MGSWFERRSLTASGGTEVVFPPAWNYNGPASDTARQSSSLTAAATVEANARDTTSKKVTRNKKHAGVDSGWQAEAWAMYDQVGELRYVSNAIAGRMGQARLFVKKNGDEIEDDEILKLITPQMVERMGLNLFVAGSCHLGGIPVETGALGNRMESKWAVYSALEAKETSGTWDIRDKKYKSDDVYMTRIWDPHPAHWEQADSPVRSSLPVLRELVGLTQHVSAQIDSRLAGAGVYWVPNTILNSAKVPESDGQAQTFSENPVLNAIMTAMLLPMEDRANASAIVPLLLGAPDDAISKIRFDTFSTPFDKNTQQLREESIRRLGLSLDSPPELLQGMGDANHWGMWLVRDEVIQTHVSPRLDLIADALQTGFYMPIQKQQPDYDENDTYEVGFDVSHLVQRPNRLADASQLHAVNALGDKALREAGGFEEIDAPTSQERAVAMALQVASGNPQLLDNMPEIVTAVLALLDGTPDSGAGVTQSQRVPGTLKPLAPGNTAGVKPPIASAPNGTPTNGRSAPLAEVEGEPAAGQPV